jgi:hypothetical protein
MWCKLHQDGVNEDETRRTISLCVKCAFVGVTNEYLSQDAKNKVCRNAKVYFRLQSGLDIYGHDCISLVSTAVFMDTTVSL